MKLTYITLFKTEENYIIEKKKKKDEITNLDSQERLVR